MKVARCTAKGGPIRAAAGLTQDLATPLKGPLEPWTASLSLFDVGAFVSAAGWVALSAARMPEVGDVCKAEIEKISLLRNTVHAPRESIFA